MNLSTQHPQYIDTVTLVRCLRRIDHKIRTGRPCRAAQRIHDYIVSELERRASAASMASGISFTI
jgi:hypothetical protein